MPTRLDAAGNVYSAEFRRCCKISVCAYRGPDVHCNRDCNDTSRFICRHVCSLYEENIVITGRCECATVKYQVSGDIVDFCHCHCSICRRIHGAAFATWGGVARDDFAFISGEDKLRTYAFSERSDSIFCSTCSSTVLVDFKAEADMLYITLGTVDGDVECPDGYHQFAGSKAPWYEITDDLPQHDGWPVHPK